MANKNAYRLALALAVVATPCAADEFGDACRAAQIFTEKDCYEIVPLRMPRVFRG